MAIFSSKTTVKKIIILLFCISLLVLIIINYGPISLNDKNQTNIELPSSKINQTKLKLGINEFVIEIADTPSKRQKGLSGQLTIGDNEGLFFIFPESSYPDFWMKEMNFPIDIIWFDDNLEVVDITANIGPETYPQTFSPIQPVKYVLEIKAGSSQQKNIVLGLKASY